MTIEEMIGMQEDRQLVWKVEMDRWRGRQANLREMIVALTFGPSEAIRDVKPETLAMIADYAACALLEIDTRLKQEEFENNHPVR